MDTSTIYILSGNAIALAASIWMVLTGLLKQKDRMVFHQTAYVSLFCLSNIVLGGFAGASSHVLTITRNLVYAKGIWKNWMAVPFSILYFAAAYLIGATSSLLWFLPPLASAILTIGICLNNDVTFKWIIMANVLIWCAYDISIMSYTAAAFDAGFAVSNMIGLARIFYGRYKERKQATEETD